MENSEFFKIICIKNCYASAWRTSFGPWTNGKIKNGQIFTTNNSDFFYLGNMTRLYSTDGDFLGLFDNSNFMKLEEYRNIKIEKLLD